MIILRPLLLLTNLHLKLLSTQGTGADKLLSTQRVKEFGTKINFASNNDEKFVDHIICFHAIACRR